MPNRNETHWAMAVEEADLDQIEAYDYELPEELVAAHPADRRRGSQLMHVDPSTGELAHHGFAELVELVRPGDRLVFNDTRVVCSRLFARKSTGGRVELFVIERADRPGDWEHLAEGRLELRCMVRSSNPLRPDSTLTLLAGDSAPDDIDVLSVDGGEATVAVDWTGSAEDFLSAHGEVPLPPYILRRRDALGQGREASEVDRTRYQTVYARAPGAVAAPTAGLHFDEEIFEALDERGVETSFVTLHVGTGTFRPVRHDRLSEHPMHSERYVIGEAACREIRATRAEGGRVIAVGTTSMRVLESEARRPRPFEPGARSTDLFLRPGGPDFRVVDGLLTNFHLPRSTLLALVSAFAGYGLMRRAYDEAIDSRYRFYSYGDAMLIATA
jgi:S-adenosylmethionine:tRNA ribosyltransferase-isomerase